MLIWCLSFLTSTWYIKNPFLKAKIVEVLFYGCWNWGEQRSVLTTLLNTHPVALLHLMPALMHFYIGRSIRTWPDVVSNVSQRSSKPGLALSSMINSVR